VPDALIALTLRECQRQFGAISCETQTIRGLWRHAGQLYRDDLIRIFADVEDSPQNQQAFKKLKRQLLRRFKQIDIWITSYPIEVL
jgi:hypothetical protein